MDAATMIPILILIALVCMALWIWALVDCATKESNEGNTKLVWVGIILMANWIGALVYLIVRRPQRRAELGR